MALLLGIYALLIAATEQTTLAYTPKIATRGKGELLEHENPILIPNVVIQVDDLLLC